MGFLGDDLNGAAKSTRPFRLDTSQEEFDREFFGQILQHGTNNTDVVRRQAELLALHGDYQDALQLDQLLSERHPDDAVVHYNLACSLSMSGAHRAAVEALTRAIELGYHDFAHIQADADLDPLRELADFHELLSRRIPEDEPPRLV